MSDWRTQLASTRHLLRTQGHTLVKGQRPGFLHTEFLEALGCVLPQYGGTRYWPVKPDPKFPGYDSRSTGALLPHTDAYEFPEAAPRYVALWCVHPATCGGGLTQLADGYAFWNSLDEATKSYLTKTRFKYHSTRNLIEQNIHWEGVHPFAEETNAGLILRVSLNNVVTNNDPTLLAVHSQIKPFFEADRFDVTWEQGDILIWDNWRWLHSRTQFKCLERELTRIWYTDLY